ncbi:substrate-binding periplasmic protein [Paludibacterium yongneupense]|uniref:substrate-binding periplasmic protein n=1 Tax=Paludibacterium yongneupense TaxID=400061 RepID=UPI0003FBD093|nr:transporter substrate-binding domain-containing protein [Paludibacterium yongneupense]
MRRLPCVAVLLWLVAAVPAYAAGCGRLVISADPSYPPLHWYDGEVLQGASIAVATRVFDDLHVPYQVRYVGPLKRVLALARSGDVDVVATLKITPERTAFLAFGVHPALSNPVVAFVDVRRPFPFRDRNDLIARRGAIALGNVFGGGFDEFMQRRLQVTETSDLNQLFKLLEYGRVDYSVIGLYPGLAWMAAQHKLGHFTALQPYLTHADNYVAFSRASPCLKWLPAFDRRLGELSRQGIFAHVSNDYLAIWAKKPVLGERDGP